MVDRPDPSSPAEGGLPFEHSDIVHPVETPREESAEEKAAKAKRRREDLLREPPLAGDDQGHNRENSIDKQREVEAARRQVKLTEEVIEPTVDGRLGEDKGAEAAMEREKAAITSRYRPLIDTATTVAERWRLEDQQGVELRAALWHRRELGYREAISPDWQQALFQDREARMVNEVYTEYEGKLERTHDVGIRGGAKEHKDPEHPEYDHPELRVGLIESRDAQIAAVRKQAQAINEKAVALEKEVATALRSDSEVTKRFDRASSPNLEEQAAANHDALLLDTLPFEVQRSGGWLRRKENRGPQVIEAFYRSADDPRIVVVERRLRHGDRLLSQTVLTSEKPIRDTVSPDVPEGAPGHHEYHLPPGFTDLPRGLPGRFARNSRIEEIRQEDKQPAVHKAGLLDYVSYGSVDLGYVAQHYYGAGDQEVARSDRAHRRPGSWLLGMLMQAASPQRRADRG